MDDLRLERLASILKKADKASDIEEIFALNKSFHGTIYSAFPQPTLMRHIRQLRNKVTPYNRMYLKVAGNKEAAWADQAALLGQLQKLHNLGFSVLQVRRI